MHRADSPKDRSRRRRPIVEALEVRDLPTTIPLPVIPSGARVLELPAINYAFNALYGPTAPPIKEPDGTTIPVPQPSTHELHREFFELKTFANYTVTTPRFGNQASTIHGSGTRGSSNQFLVGRPQLIVFQNPDLPNVNPTRPPIERPATGIINVLASNFLFSGATIVLDLTEAKVDPNGTVDPVNGQYQRGPNGLPLHFTWTLDPTSGSVYTGSTGSTPNPAYAAQFNNGNMTPSVPGPNGTILPLPPSRPGPTGSGTGAGQLDFAYTFNRHSKSPAAANSGLITITAQGLTNVSGINNTAAQNFS